MQDLFIGTWKLSPPASNFDPNHKPREGTMRLERDADGAYILNAEGVNEKGERCVERTHRMVPDGKAYPLPEFPGLSATTTQPDARTLRGVVTREDGSVAGEGTYVVSADGRALVATTAGFDTQLRRFEQKTAWDRIA